ncbi:hypothetical protein [Marinobacter sp. SS5-14b]|uniref:hypothetical protein n=1 Tax=Marinobacter sp. SS5-14b TaxID=3050456 RepID=UPI0026E0E8DE|nr:hypothetical protein [Marinobacter sp. SS5-14b]
MHSTYTNLPIVKHQVYRKDRALMYQTAGLLFATICGLAYWFYLDTSSVVPAIIFIIFTSSVFWGYLRLDFGNINHMVEVTPEFLRVDDCPLKEIAWRDIAQLKLEKRSNSQGGRSALLIIYLKDGHRYRLPKPGRFISKQLRDGGIIATNLYNYEGDYNEIFEQLCVAREGGQFFLWSSNRVGPLDQVDPSIKTCSVLVNKQA